MHNLNIMHRDLKPENLLCEQTEDGNIIIKLTDFGFATHFSQDRQQSLSLGSPLYMAPELCLERPYDNKVDVWAVGVIIFVLLTGSPPFKGRTKAEIYKRITKMEPSYDKLANASPTVKQVIEACLKKKAADRPSMDDLLQFDWFQNSV
mmetsp:Transcript_11570/g.15644  ORF Transcript_11570/g.15644 Transcript_11570/m.15644 type:complete len:149 (+) Transcript_11570:623-1069(+)